MKCNPCVVRFAGTKIMTFFLFVFFISSNAVAQDSIQDNFSIDRVNACFTNPGQPSAEILCLYYNKTFSYNFTKGGIHKYARGNYYGKHDTIFFSSAAVNNFSIKASFSPSIAAGEIRIQVLNLKSNPGNVLLAAGQDDFKTALTLNKGRGVYYEIIKRPKSGILKLQHTLYKDEPEVMKLKKNKNDFTVTLSDSLGWVSFEGYRFAWEGDKPYPVFTDKKNIAVSFLENTAIGFAGIPWKNSKPEITADEFTAWNKKQEIIFGSREKRRMDAMVKKEQVSQNKMRSRVLFEWDAAIEQATLESTAIIALFEADSIGVETDFKQTARASCNYKPGIINKYLPEEYDEILARNKMLPDKRKLPVFYQSRRMDDDLRRKLMITALPAIIITSNNGTLLFKREGSIPSGTQIERYYDAAMKAWQNEINTAFITAYHNSVKDSNYLVSAIKELATFNNSSLYECLAAGITIKRVTDTLIANYTSQNSYSAGFYDFVATAWFGTGFSGPVTGPGWRQPVSPAMKWLFSQFRKRQNDTIFSNKPFNDSIVITTCFNLMNIIYAVDTSVMNKLADYPALLQLNKQILTGHGQTLDFYMGVFYLTHKFELAHYLNIKNSNDENELRNFLSKNMGASLSVSSYTDSLRQCYRRMIERNDKFFIDAYMWPLMALKSEEQFINQNSYRISYLTNVLAVLIMDKYNCPVLSGSLIKEANVLPLFALSANLGTQGGSEISKLNYAYALYETGDVKHAANLIANTLKSMETMEYKSRKYIEQIKKTKINLDKMNAGKEISVLISDMIY